MLNTDKSNSILCKSSDEEHLLRNPLIICPGNFPQLQILFIFIFVLGPHSAVLKDCFQLCKQGSLLLAFKRPYGVPGIKPSWPHSSQDLYSLQPSYEFKRIIIKIMKSKNKILIYIIHFDLGEAHREVLRESLLEGLRGTYMEMGMESEWVMYKKNALLARLLLCSLVSFPQFSFQLVLQLHP